MRRSLLAVSVVVLVAGVVAWLAAGGSGSDAAGQWVIRDLGVPGVTSEAFAVSESGVVIGTSGLRGGRGFVWRGGRMVDLGPVDGGEDLAVNDLGQVAGNHWVGEDQLRAFVWRSGQRRDLRVGRDQDRAHDINNAGQIVGDSSRGAFLWRGGKTRMLKGVQWAYGINERGQVVGGAVDRQGRRRALLWWRGRVTDLGGGSALALNESGEVLCEGVYGPFLWRDGRRISIGSVGEFGGVVALNNSGQVIGEVDDAAGRHAFIWERGRRQMILPAYETSVAAINNHGFIVGLRAKTMSSQSEAFVWRDGRATPLPGLGGTSVVPVAVNDREQIIGTATTTGDRISHAVLWTKTG